MGHVEVGHLTYVLPDGRPLLNDVSFRIGDGVKAALVGPNGAGKTTLMRLVAGDLQPIEGSVASSGGLGVMRQFIGSVRDGSTVHDLLLSVAPPAVRQAAERLDAGRAGDDGARRREDADALRAGHHRLRRRRRLRHRGALGHLYGGRARHAVRQRANVGTWPRCPGGEQKRLVLEALLRGPDQTLLLDEPDNYLDVPGKGWLEQQLRETPKTVLLVSHDRELLANAADRIVTVESGGIWIHGGGFGTYAEARKARNDRLDELRRRWDEEHAKLKALVNMLKNKARYNDGMAAPLPRGRDAAAQVRGGGAARGDAAATRTSRMRLRGGRTGKRAVICEELELTGLMRPFDLEIWYGERVAVLGSNGSGKSHFLRLLAGEQVAHTGVARLGARVVPGHFAQTHARPDLLGRTPVEIVMTEHALLKNEAMTIAGPLRAGRTGRRAAVRHTVGRSAGPAADPAAGAVGRDAAAARRADRQPRPGQRRGAAGGAGRLRGHGAGGHARPLVRR